MSLPLCSKPFPAVQCHRQSFRVAAMPLPVSSSPSVPFMAIPLLVASIRFSAVPFPLFWILCHSVPSRFGSSRRPWPPCPFQSWLSYAMPFPICALRLRIYPMLCRIKSSPLQSAPSRFFASLFSAKQGGANPLPLGSRRFQLCSALPFQILESHLQALPWLLFAFPCRAIPHLFGSLRLRWPRFQICSFRLLSQPLRSSAMPIWANRFSAPPSHIVSPQLDAISGQIRSCPSISKPCPFDSTKSGLITSVAFRVRSM